MKQNLLLLLGATVLFDAVAEQKPVIQFYTPNTVRVTWSANDNAETSLQQSYVVRATPEKVKVSTSKKNGDEIYRTSALTLTVKEGEVVFADTKGNVLTTATTPSFEPITSGPDSKSYKVEQSFTISDDEQIYGFGMLQNGKMSQRGEDRRMEQSNLEDFAHFYQSIKGYGIYWDNYSPTHLNTPEQGVDGKVSFNSQVGDRSDFYFIYGKDADGVIKSMRQLTGHCPMLPMWTYGFHQCRERYKTQDELLEVVHRYRALGVPFDGIIQDWQYWGSNYNWNSMEFLSEGFPQAQAMIDEVHNQNAHLSISIWASFGPETKAYKEMKPKGQIFSFETWPSSGSSLWPPKMDYPSGVRVYDAYSPEARQTYWKYLSNLHRMGIDAWWMDSTDPDHLNFKEEDLDEKCYAGTYRSVRNAFPLMSVEGVYDNQRAVDTQKRVFILTRSYFAGQQRTGANTWSGDVTSSWENFRRQIPLCLNYTLTANPQVNSDLGGFFSGSYNTHGANSATKNPQYQELYVRWMQFGTFCPMMRSHGADTYRELYYYGNPGEPVYDALLAAVKLRYRFMPYIYSQAWQVSKNDDSFMRALFMDFKTDKQTWKNNRQYLFGHNVLVCPVVDPQYTPEQIIKGSETNYDAPDWTAEKQYQVYLPAGTQWYDYWTNAKLDGGQTINTTTTLANAPLYIKAGAILPQGPDVQYTNQQQWDNLEVVVYPGANGSFTLYEDEGDNYNYEQGLYSEIPMTWNDKAKTLTIGARNGSFDGMLTSRTFLVRTVDGAVHELKYNGKKVSIKL